MDSKDELNTKLLRFRRETISPVDEEWLDHEASIVDEQCVLDELEVASDYDGTRASIVTKLKEWTGELVNVAGNKRILVQNIIYFFAIFRMLFLANLRKPINLENPYFGLSTNLTKGYGSWGCRLYRTCNRDVTTRLFAGYSALSGEK